MARPVALASALVASLLLTGCAIIYDGEPSISPVTEAPPADSDAGEAAAGAPAEDFCDSEFAYARVDLAAERGEIFDWADDPAVYGYAPIQTDVGHPWCAFVSYAEGWVDGVYLETDLDEFLAELERGGLTVNPLDATSAEISGNPSASGTDGFAGTGFVYLHDSAEDIDRPYIQVLWYPDEPPQE